MKKATPKSGLSVFGSPNCSMVDRYAKFATEHLAAAASRIESVSKDSVINLAHFCHSATK